MEEKKFYSRQELDEFKEIILTKLDEALVEKKRLAESLREVSGNSVDSFNMTEFGNESQEKEQIEILLARQNRFILNLQNALVRIENGSYGVCKETGKLIPKERLRLVPHTTTTVEGKGYTKVSKVIEE
ncbi:MAG: TraR/DksA C4-type zinc finger protein [Bacteroidia bacterium]|nr:TraR/DksA C4-type zinc finger protein [Bacteroidia bacterium]